jgi:two-component system cell cycle sensor histidine kinase/response regulator CckA
MPDGRSSAPGAPRREPLVDRRAVEIPELLVRGPDAVLLLDAEATVLDVNEEACRSLGYAREELLGKKPRDFVDGLEGPPLERMMAILKERGVASFNAVHRRKDGSRFPVETRLAVLRRGGPPIIVAFARDVSERERAEAERAALEERLRQSEKLEALGTLAGGVAHDFNNVLAAILGHADALVAELPPGDAGREDAIQIATAARRAKGVVQQILAFARRRPAELRPVDVATAIREELPLVRAALPATVELAPRLDAAAGAVHADPTHLHQILLNLAANGRDAMAERGGLLEVEVARVEVPGAGGAPPGLAAGSWVRLSVRDTGVGMDAATRARAFEPYFTMKPLGAGSGLGLAVVHGIAVSLGGTVTLESAPGRGTTVSVWLPRLDGAAAATRTPTPAAGDGEGRILLVDDDPPVARAISRMLESLGYEVITAGDGASALARFRAEPARFDAVITDQTLPGMLGDELTTALLAVRPGVPVLICTGFSERLDDDAARALGARALLMKPLDRAQLGEALRAAIAARPD